MVQNKPQPKMDRSPSKSTHEQQRQPSFPPKTERSPAKSMQPTPHIPPKVDRSPAKPLPKESTVKGKEKAFLSTLRKCYLTLVPLRR